MSDKIIYGFERRNNSDIRNGLSTASSIQAEFVLTPLFHPRLRRDVIGVSETRKGPGTRSDRELESRDWVSNVIGKVSHWIDLDSPLDNIRKASEATFKKEISWTSFSIFPNNEQLLTNKI